MNPADAQKMLVATRAKAEVALAVARAQAFESGKKLARAANASSDLKSQTQAALLVRDAYWQRIGAEGEKHRATYLLLAAKERAIAAEAAANIKNARDQRYIVERINSYSVRANLLEQAAERAAAAVKNVPEPEVVSWRRAQRLATAMGTDLSADNTAPVVAARMSPLLNSKLYNPLVDWMYTPGIKLAAGGLAGVGEAGVTPGDGTSGTSFMDSVKRALGIGISEASKTATQAARDASKDNPGTATIAAGAGGILAAVADLLGVSFQQGYDAGQGQTTEGERKFPWGAAAAVATVGVVGYILWRAR